MSRSSVSRLVGVVGILALLASSAFAAKICIDPGHGGSDPGAVGNGLLEKNCNLQAGNTLKWWFDLDTNNSAGGSSWTPIMTRSTDVFVDLSVRTSYANGQAADRFMSIHSNGFSDPSANGICTYCYTSGSSNSFDLRNKVYEEAVAMWPLTRRGVYTANFYVVKYTNMPAELHEMAFITNYTDSTYLGDSYDIFFHALSELYAAQRHYGVAKFAP